MAEYIDRDEAIRILKQLQEKRQKSCGRAAIYESTALGYAIKIIEQMDTVIIPDE